MKSINKRLFEEVKPYWGRIIATIVLIFVGAMFQAMTPWPFKILIDNVLGNDPVSGTSILDRLLSIFQSREALGLFAVGVYLGSSVLSNLADYWSSVKVKHLGQDIVQSFSQKVFNNLERMNLRHYRQQDIGDYLYRLGYDTSALGNLFEDGFLPIFTNVAYLIVTVVILFTINVRLTVLAIAVLPAMAYCLIVFNKKIGHATTRSEHSNSLLFTFIQEILNQLKNVQAFNQETHQSGHFEQEQHRALTHETQVYTLGFRMSMVISLIITLGYSVILLYGLHLAFLSQITAGLLIVFIFYMDNLTSPIMAVVAAAGALREQYVKLSRLQEFFKPEFQFIDNGTITALETPEIRFDKVFVLGEDNTPILHNISFHVPPFKKTVIIGVSGSGKTTLLSLLMRFIEPDRGIVKLGDTDLSHYNLRALREQITYVPQEIALFNESIKFNIAFGHPEATPHEIHEAARLADATEFISRLPETYDFQVGEGGANLSGGQRQRILLARAFLKKDARFAIFDEPLSALDVKTRAVILHNIGEFSKGKTTIIISNVLEVLDKADHVIVLNEGTLIHEGHSMVESNLSKMILNS